MTTQGALTVPFDTSVTQLGQGFDSVNRIAKGTVLEVPQGEQVRFDKTKQEWHDGMIDSTVPSPQTGVTFSMKFAETTTQLRDLLNITGSASLSKGTVTGSIQGSFNKTKVTDRNKVYVILTLTVTHSVYALDPRRINVDTVYVPGAEGSQMEASKFVTAFGDHFVQAVVVGGSLSAMLEITKNSDEETRDIKAAANVTVQSTFEVSGEVQFEMAVSSLTQNRRTDITMVSVGGNVQTTPSTTQELIRLARRFPLMVLGGVGQTVGDQLVGEENGVANDEGNLLQVEPEVFAGNAVPVKLITMPYASLPQWNTTVRLQDELAGYIIDDAVEVFEEIDAAKNSVSTMISEFDGNNLNLTDLTDLVDIERMLREVQVTLLKLLTPAEPAEGEPNALLAAGIEKAIETADELKTLTPAAWYMARANEVLARAALRYAYSARKGEILNPDDYILLSGDETLQTGGNKLVTGDVVRLRSISQAYYEYSDVAIYEEALSMVGFATAIRNLIIVNAQQKVQPPDNRQVNVLTEEEKKEYLGDDYNETDVGIAVKYSTMKQQSLLWIPESGGNPVVVSALKGTEESGRVLLLHLTSIVQQGSTQKVVFFQQLDPLGASEGFLRVVWPYNGGGVVVLQKDKTFEDITQLTGLSDEVEGDFSYFFYVEEATENEQLISTWTDGSPLDTGTTIPDGRPSFLPNALWLRSAESGLYVYTRRDDVDQTKRLLTVRAHGTSDDSNLFVIELVNTDTFLISTESTNSEPAGDVGPADDG